jgi:predicted HTH transcriptional regulator
MVLNKPLESIEESDLQALVDNQVSERKTIEYKAALPGNADGDKKEFLADVSSFANASAGDLIYGIREQYGVPVELSGLQLSDVDAEILRLESCIQTGIAPRLFRIVETHSIALPSKQRYAFIIRIRKSWMAPHKENSLRR